MDSRTTTDQLSPDDHARYYGHERQREGSPSAAYERRDCEPCGTLSKPCQFCLHEDDRAETARQRENATAKFLGEPLPWKDRA